MDFIPTFQGQQLEPGTSGYEKANNIYATSSLGVEHNMNPGEILRPTCVQDIQDTIRYAFTHDKPLAIRTGGHQYCGACSCGPEGIQLDLSGTFRNPAADLKLTRDAADGKLYLRAGVSWQLQDIFKFLQANGIFMPSGQCITVCLGGHIQTGGYGMLARSFGLLGDYVRELEIVDHAGEVVHITKEANPDLYYGFLGGSPGNMGVLTHLTVEVQEDKNHQGSQGQWVAFGYRKDTLKALLDLLVQKSDDPNFSRGYDFNINIVSRGTNVLDLFPGTEEELQEALPNWIWDGIENFADYFNFEFALIVVYAQWVNLGTEKFSPDLFNEIRSVPHGFHIYKPSEPGDDMSKIAAMWLFKSDREFAYPYIKRTNTTNSKTLSKSGWSEWFSGRVDSLVSDHTNGLKISSQIQVFNGTDSMFSKNANNGTSYSWRDSTIGGTWDVFYQDGKKEAAEAWQAENDKGLPDHFSKADRRLLWGSYGDWNMKNVWQNYYEPATYQKLRAIRKAADPRGTFTPNPFCVEAAD